MRHKIMRFHNASGLFTKLMTIVVRHRVRDEIRHIQHSQVKTLQQYKWKNEYAILNSPSFVSNIRRHFHSIINSLISSSSDIAKKYPPSLRIIVQETNIKKLKIGELFLITYIGEGTSQFIEKNIWNSIWNVLTFYCLLNLHRNRWNAG